MFGIINYKLFKMKKLFFTIIFCAIFNPIFSQEDFKIQISFYKVDETKRAEYESVMTDIFGKIMKQRVKEGCMKNWIFRRVIPNSSMGEQFTHMTIDVLNTGSDNYACGELESIRKKVFPNQSEEIFNILRDIKNSSRNVIYRTKLSHVSGYNKIEGKNPQFAMFCITKTKNGNYKKRHKDEEWLNAAEKAFGQDAWHAFERDDFVNGTKEWNYLTIDGYENANDIYTGNKPFPSKLNQKIQEKYGKPGSQRDIWKRINTRLIYSAKN